MYTVQTGIQLLAVFALPIAVGLVLIAGVLNRARRDSQENHTRWNAELQATLVQLRKGRAS